MILTHYSHTPSHNHPLPLFTYSLQSNVPRIPYTLNNWTPIPSLHLIILHLILNSLQQSWFTTPYSPYHKCQFIILYTQILYFYTKSSILFIILFIIHYLFFIFFILSNLSFRPIKLNTLNLNNILINIIFNNALILLKKHWIINLRIIYFFFIKEFD